MKIDLSNNSVLITGSTGGIGKALCHSFAKANAKVILHFNKQKDAAKNLINSLPGDGHSLIQADLSNSNEIKDMVDSISDLDIVINNAALVEQVDMNEMSYNDWIHYWRKTLEVNLLGPADLTFLCANRMKMNGGGKFINISSRGAFRGEPKAPAYGSSKSALNSFGQSMALALAKDKIFFYTIAPGFVETDRVKDIINDEIRAQSPLNRVAKPEEVAQTALWLASSGNDFLTGSIIDVNGASYFR